MDEELIVAPVIPSRCECNYLLKKDIGSTENEGAEMYHIYICPHHKTIQKHHILTGETI